MSDIAYRLSDPYPMPMELAPNHRWARLLCNNYCGPVSELTAITKYIYQQVSFEESQPHVAEVLRKVAIVEMKHLDLLGRCVRELGLDPRYRFFRRGRPMYWNAGYVEYIQDLPALLQENIEGEQRAISGYQDTISLVPDAQIRALLQRIIREEELHIQIFSALLNSLRQQPSE